MTYQSEATDPVFDAMENWATSHVEMLANKAVYRLTRIKAAGLFSEYNFRSVWDEYSYDAKEGPHGGFSELLHDMMHDACSAIVEKIPPHEMGLYAVLAVALEDKPQNGPVWYLEELVRDQVGTLAYERNLQRYANDYKWWEDQ